MGGQISVRLNVPAVPAAALIDLPEAIYRSDKRIGQYSETATLVAGEHVTLPVMAFADCWIDLYRVFPISASMHTCRELFQCLADDKYEHYYKPDYAAQLKTYYAVDHDNVFAIGGTDYYWHFLIDQLSRLPALCGSPAPTPKILVNHGLPAGYRELLVRACAFLKIEDPAIEEAPRQIVRVRNAIVPCRQDFAIALHFLRSLGLSIQQDASDAPERIFIRRGNVKVRRVANEAELEEKLHRAFGFVAVDCGTMPAIEQIKLFSKARIVVAGHGGALTNTIFASRLTDCVELYVSERRNFFEAVSQCFGRNHHWIEGRPEPAHAGDLARSDNQDYSVDADALLSRVDAILNSRASHSAAQ